MMKLVVAGQSTDGAPCGAHGVEHLHSSFRPQLHAKTRKTIKVWYICRVTVQQIGSTQ